MEHHLGPVFREKTFHQGLVAHIRHAHGEAFGMPRCGQLHLQVVERALCHVDQQQMLRTQGRQLPDQPDPMLPAAPVTSTRRPAKRARTSASSSRITGRPSRSSMRTARICPALNCP